MAFIGLEDLIRLAEIAEKDRNSFFDRYPRWRALYQDRVIAVALCQGAAFHFLDRTSGVKDFDVWTFYEATPTDPKRAFLRRAVKSVDFDSDRFGRHPNFPKFRGRKVDLLDRVLPRQNESAVEVLREYLRKRKTETASMLAKKAMVLIDPPELLGAVVWPEL
jgi:hypothetical protein